MLAIGSAKKAARCDAARSREKRRPDARLKPATVGALTTGMQEK
jgi:hypothetical protein